MEGSTAAAVRAVIEPAVQDLGYALIFVDVTGSGGRRILRLYIDRSEGIGLEDCASVSRQVSPMLDVEDALDGPFVLEVSSPGLERPLVRPTDFERHQGARVKLQTGKAIEGRRRFSGTLRGWEDDVVVLEDEDGTEVRIPYTSLKRANIVHRFEEDR